MNDKITTFARLLEAQQTQRLHEQQLNCQTNLNNAKVTVKPGQKYTKVDIGTSGRYMVENATGNIFGIKGYGQVHKGHFYGTVDTIGDYFWGNYYPEKVVGNAIPLQKYTIPALTFAPEPPKPVTATQVV